MLLAEDRAVKLEQPGMSVRARQQIEAERHDHLSNALGYFQVSRVLCETNTIPNLAAIV